MEKDILEKAEELWDSFSEHMGDDGFSFSRFAGTTIMTREQFMQAAAELIQPTIEVANEGLEEKMHIEISNAIFTREGYAEGQEEAAKACAAIAQEEMGKLLEWIRKEGWQNGGSYWINSTQVANSKTLYKASQTK